MAWYGRVVVDTILVVNTTTEASAPAVGARETPSLRLDRMRVGRRRRILRFRRHGCAHPEAVACARDEKCCYEKR